MSLVRTAGSTRVNTFLSSAAALTIFSLGAVAQSASPNPPAGQTPRIQAGAEEVVLDVVVRDKKGKLMTGLKNSDFVISDNGEQRPVKSFRYIHGTEALAGGSGAPSPLDPLRQLRLITLVFQGIDNNSKKLARDAATELLKSELAQNVYVSVMYIDFRLQAIQTFTNDRALLARAIDAATAQVNDHVGDNNRVRTQLAALLGKPEASGDTTVAGTVQQQTPNDGPVNNNGAAMAMQEMMYDIVRTAEADVQTQWSRGSVYPLLDLVREQYRLPGRKTIIYFSGGFPLGQDTEDAFKTVISIANRSNVSFYSVDITGLTTWSSNQNATGALREAARQSAANVGTSGKGISMAQAEAADMAYEAGSKDTQNNLAMLAEQTGGALIANTNDFRAPIRRAVEDAESYYEITYNPEIQKYDGSFRKISVRTDVKEARVQTRAGYFALPPNLTQGQVLAPWKRLCCSRSRNGPCRAVSRSSPRPCISAALAAPPARWRSISP